MISKSDYSPITLSDVNAAPVYPAKGAPSGAGSGAVGGSAENGGKYFGDILRSQHGTQIDAEKLSVQSPSEAGGGNSVQPGGNKLPGLSVSAPQPIAPQPITLRPIASLPIALRPIESRPIESPVLEQSTLELPTEVLEAGQGIFGVGDEKSEARISEILGLAELIDPDQSGQQEPSANQAIVVDQLLVDQAAKEASNVKPGGIQTIPAAAVPEIFVNTELAAENRFREDGQAAKQFANTVVLNGQHSFSEEYRQNGKPFVQPTLDLGNTDVLAEKSERIGVFEQIVTRMSSTSQFQAVPGGSPLVSDQPNLSPTPKTIANSTIPTPLKEPGWGSEFVGRMSLMLKGGVSEASIQLNPPELGRIEIKLSTEGEQVKVLFTVQHAAAREAIEQAMPRLREMLEQGGLQLEQSDVADQSQSNLREHGVEDIYPVLDADEWEEDSGEANLELGITAPDSAVDYYI